MARAKGEVIVREWKAGRGFALRFTAYGHREYLTLGLQRDGWTRERAEEELANIMADVRRGIWVAPSKRTRRAAVEEEPEKAGDTPFPAFAERLLEERREEMSDGNHAYLAWGLAHLRPFFADWALTEIDAEAVDAYRAHKVTESRALARAIECGRPKRDEHGRVRRPLGPATINKTIDALSWFLRIAVEYKRYGLTENAAAGKRRRLAEPQRVPVYLDSAAQIEALLDAAAELDAEHHRRCAERSAIVATLVLAGPRASELCRMLWRDVDLANARIFIGRSKTQAGLREITMLPVLRDLLAAHKAAAYRARPNDLVFPTGTGGRRNPNNLRERILIPALARADELLEERGQVPLPRGVTPHKLRHTFASVLIAVGEDPATVMRQLGHTDPRFTLKVYTHLMARSPAERKHLKALVAGERERHRVVPTRLGWQAFEAPILRALAERGGRSTRREVLAALGEEMAGRLGEADLASYRGAPRWHLDADLARRHLLKCGLLRESRREGAWELSEAGAERARQPHPAVEPQEIGAPA